MRINSCAGNELKGCPLGDWRGARDGAPPSAPNMERATAAGALGDGVQLPCGGSSVFVAHCDELVVVEMETYFDINMSTSLL